MKNPDNNSLYVLVYSLAATVISLPAVWYFTAFASLPKDVLTAALNAKAPLL